MAAAQNVRAHKRSRPLIQTPDPDLSNGVDPDLWSRPLEWWNIWASWCLQLFTLPSKQQTVVKPRCQAARVAKPRCQAVKLRLLHIQAVKQPSCPLAACSPCRPFLVTLHPRCNIHKKVGPILGLGRSRPGSRPDPDHNQLRVSPC